MFPKRAEIWLVAKHLSSREYQVRKIQSKSAIAKKIFKIHSINLF